MISEIGTQIDLLEDRVAGSLTQQSEAHRQEMTDLVTSQDDKIAMLEDKLYSLGSGVADLEQASTAQLDEVRGDGTLLELLSGGNVTRQLLRTLLVLLQCNR